MADARSVALSISTASGPLAFGPGREAQFTSIISGMTSPSDQTFYPRSRPPVFLILFDAKDYANPAGCAPVLNTSKTSIRNAKDFAELSKTTASHAGARATGETSQRQLPDLIKPNWSQPMSRAGSWQVRTWPWTKRLRGDSGAHALSLRCNVMLST